MPPVKGLLAELVPRQKMLGEAPMSRLVERDLGPWLGLLVTWLNVSRKRCL